MLNSILYYFALFCINLSSYSCLTSLLDLLRHMPVCFCITCKHSCIFTTHIILFLTALGEERLWSACLSGDIGHVKELTAEEVNLNWKKHDMAVSDFSYRYIPADVTHCAKAIKMLRWTQKMIISSQLLLYNIQGSTPLLIATMYGHKDVVDELLKGGADPNIPSDVKSYTLL